MLKFIRYVINFTLIIVVVGLAAVFLLPQALGYQPYMVVSASMQQSFPVGSLIFVKDIAPEDVQVGDPITFTSGTLNITHRVLSINRSARVFTTKGDNNSASEQIPFDSVRGKALDFCIPQMGYFASWFVTSTGRLTTLLIILSLAFMSFTLGKLEESGKEGDETDPHAILQEEFNSAGSPAVDETETPTVFHSPDGDEAAVAPSNSETSDNPAEKEGDTW